MTRSERGSLEKLFENPTRDAAYLFQVARTRGGIPNMQVCLLPTPPGWKGYGRLWAVFHTPQMVEEGHDPVYQVDESRFGLRIGREIPEDDLAGWRIKQESYAAKLTPVDSKIAVDVDVTLKAGIPRALPFRINDNYRFGQATVAETQTSFVYPRSGQLVRAGSLLIPWTDRPASRYRFRYVGRLPSGPDDEIVEDAAYVTSWWLPSLGRLPFTVRATIDAPAGWVVRAEGTRLGSRVAGRRKVERFFCGLPISFPKIVAGEYVLVAQEKAFLAYQLRPLDRVQAEMDLELMKKAESFYRSRLGALPFEGYECYSAEKFYGIESYSHTLLQRNVTHFVPHEMGHSYFGGDIPCPYVHDSWNEGVTEYFDSVLFQKDRDKTLERGLRTLSIRTPLSKMAVPWAQGAATYWRGAYVMKMLEAEIGLPAIYAACRTMIKTRRGMDTRWASLRPYFEKTGKERLDWFWRQWIEGAVFPTLKVKGTSSQKIGAGYCNKIKVEQSGTHFPYRLRFAIVAAGLVKIVSMDRKVQVFTVQSAKNPSKIALQVFPFTLATVSPEIE